MRPNPRRQKLSVFCPDESDIDSEDHLDDAEEPQSPPRKKIVRDWDTNDLEPNGTAIRFTDEEYEANIAFCCKECNCPDEEKIKFPKDDDAIQTFEDGLFHRKCCHRKGPPFVDEEWMDALHEAKDKIIYFDSKCSLPGTDNNKQDKECVPIEVPKGEIQAKHRMAERQVSELYNDDELEDPSSVLLSNELYAENLRYFTKLRLKRGAEPERRRATVLSCFSGIGADIVCLKRLGIDIAKVIHVEHDKVATHVFMSNHNSKYEETLADDDIEYVHIPKFEDIRDNLHAILNKEGRGPPCVDYAMVNANRQGVDGSQGQYMVQFGELVIAIKERQRRMQQQPVFFLAENTAISDHKDLPIKKGDLTRIKAAFGLDWSILFDSRLITPLRRKRTYLTNIPFISTYIACDPKPSTCFDNDGFDIAGNTRQPDMITRAPGLMASRGRIDDDRMDLYMKKTGRYYKRKIKVRERERLMGFPEGYVANPVESLFATLAQDGHEQCYLDERRHWKKRLHRKYHDFAGDYHGLQGEFLSYKFKSSRHVDDPILMQMAPPLAGNLSYAKRLIGNSFSIPTVELLLQPLRSLFSSREYPTFNYSFAWIPKTDDSRCSPTTSETNNNERTNYRESAGNNFVPQGEKVTHLCQHEPTRDTPHIPEFPPNSHDCYQGDDQHRKAVVKDEDCKGTDDAGVDTYDNFVPQDEIENYDCQGEPARDTSRMLDLPRNPHDCYQGDDQQRKVVFKNEDCEGTNGAGVDSHVLIDAGACPSTGFEDVDI